MELSLLRADRIRDIIETAERNRVTELYRQAYEDAKRRARLFASRTGYTNNLNADRWQSLENEFRRIYEDVNKNVAREAVNAMQTTTQGVTKEFGDYMISMGLPDGTYFQAVRRSIVESILNGTVYQQKDNLGYRAKNWGLSKSIWTDNQKNIKDIHMIIARGAAEGLSTYDIAKQLEQYVTPQRMKQWDWGKVYPDSKKHIDYNAQRLVRTLINHAYQQSFKEQGKYNPWISYYIWHSVFAHGRTCQTCMDMDGNHYRREDDINSDLPDMLLDHPNGLCYFTYEIDTTKMPEQLADWVADPEGTYPEIDKYIDYISR